MHKRVLPIFLLLVVIAACLAGCESNKDDVVLATVEQATRYAKRNTDGTPIYEYSETGDYEITYYFRDKEKGFLYTVRSYVYTIWCDTVWGYSERKETNFDKTYYQDAVDSLTEDLKQIFSQYGIQSAEQGVSDFCNIEIANPDNAKAAAETIGQLFENYDTRKHWDETQTISVYDESQTYIGSYKIRDQYYTQEEEQIDKFLQRAADELNTSKKNLVYQRTCTVDIDCLPNLNTSDLQTILSQEPKTKVTLYYFTYKDKEYYISDALLTSGKYYNSYADDPDAKNNSAPLFKILFD